MTVASPRSVVLVTATEPEPRTFGKQVVIGGLLDHLCERLGADRVHVVLISSVRQRPATPYAVHVLDKPRPAEQLGALATRVALPPHSPLQEAALWSPGLGRELRAVLEEIDADLEIWDTMRVGQYARLRPRSRRILYADDLFSKRYTSMLERIADDPTKVSNPLGEFAKLLPGLARTLATRPWVYTPLLKLERRLVAAAEDEAPRHFDQTLLVSEDETRELRERASSDTAHTLPPLLRAPRANERSFDGRPTFVFLGGLDFAPNRDGLTWFLSTCRDSVLSAVPNVEVLVIGRGSSDLPLEAEAWGGRVKGLGWVEDLDVVLGSAAALISPLRIGSGIKIKVLESLARGLPVVATPEGVLGLNVDASDGCLVADTPAELARCFVEAVDPDRNKELSAAALRRWQLSSPRAWWPGPTTTYSDWLRGLTTTTSRGSGKSRPRCRPHRPAGSVAPASLRAAAGPRPRCGARRAGPRGTTGRPRRSRA